MIVGIQGTRGFSEYQILLRAMRTSLSSIEDKDKEFFIYSAGPANVNSMIMEFSEISKRSLKAYGVNIKYFNVPPSWIEKNINSLDYFVFLSKPGEKTSQLVEVAEDNDVDVVIYRY